jgi:type VI secretion system protein ImpA
MFAAEALLNPISEAQPAGADLSFSSELDAIALARKFDDPSLDQGEWVTDLKEADWDFVVKRCAALLGEKSKDLRLAVWLTEAAAKQHRLRGLAEGYRVLAGLCEQFWDQGLYPEADGGDQDQRIGNLSWILARTPTLLREMPLTEGRSMAYSTIDFETARKRANSSSGGDDGAPKLADMETARRNNSAQFAAAFAADAQYCMDALLQLERAADTRLGQDSPGFAAARDAVQTMLHAMPAKSAKAGADDHHGADQAMHDTAVHVAQPHDSGATAADAAPAPRRAGPPGAIETRAQAIAQLRAVAQFFRRTEPHSPVSYFAEKAANAGEQDLHTWLRSVIKDESSLSHIEELLGVQPPP